MFQINVDSGAFIVILLNMNPIYYELNSRVKLTEKSFQNILNGNKSIKAFPCDSYLNKIKKYINQEATVTHIFRPSYEITIRFNDGQHFHTKDDYIEKI